MKLVNSGYDPLELLISGEYNRELEYLNNEVLTSTNCTKSAKSVLSVEAHYNLSATNIRPTLHEIKKFLGQLDWLCDKTSREPFTCSVKQDTIA